MAEVPHNVATLGAFFILLDPPSCRIWDEPGGHNFAKYLVAQFDDAEERVEKMVHFAPEGTDEVSQAALDAAKQFWEGADRVNDVQYPGPHTAVRAQEEEEVMKDAKENFQNASSRLDEIIRSVWSEAPEDPSLA